MNILNYNRTKPTTKINTQRSGKSCIVFITTLLIVLNKETTTLTDNVHHIPLYEPFIEASRLQSLCKMCKFIYGVNTNNVFLTFKYDRLSFFVTFKK